jgi:hypothetical protein
VPKATTRATAEIKSHSGQPLRVTVGAGGAAAAGGLTASEDGVAVAAGVAASAADGMTVSEDERTVAASGGSATACLDERVRGWADNRVA